MGYWISDDGIIIKDPTKAIALLEKYKEDNQDFAYEWADFLITDTGHIDFGDWFRESGDLDMLVDFLRLVVEEGILTYRYDDGDYKGRFIFDGKGYVTPQTGYTYYGDVFDEFMLHYGDMLPVKLKEGLEAWRVAKGI